MTTKKWLETPEKTKKEKPRKAYEREWASMALSVWIFVI
jgi:hypothetical protein